MITGEEIFLILSGLKEELADRYKVKKIGVFGSFARGDASEKSDVDILVEYSETPGFFGFIELEDYLKEKLGRNVDLATQNALKPAIRKRVISEIKYV
ncbi:MAG: nucleotidyltransferase family protein [Deltaproteobacteria bacterium]|nr:nucleotidyltransferase family protein [Deltaproteobacteria bacterium]